MVLSRLRLTSVLLLVLLASLLAGLADSFNEREANGQFRRLQAQPIPAPDPQILLIGIDDELYRQGRFNRAEHAHLIERLTEAGARLIFFDVMFEDPRSPEIDIPLATAVANSRRVVLAGAYQAEVGAYRRPLLFPELTEAVLNGWARLGVINTATKKVKDDSTLVYLDREDDPARNPWGAGPKLSAGAALLAACNHLGVQDVELREATWWRATELSIPPMRIPLKTMGGNTGHGVESYGIPLRFHPPATGPEGKPGAPGRFPVISYLQAADDDAMLPLVRNKIVLIGENSSTDTDLVQTPLGKMKGVEVHATVLDTLLRGDVPVLPLPGTPFGYLSRALLIVFCCGVAWGVYRQPSAARAALLLISAGALWELTVWWADRHLYFLNQTQGEAYLVITTLFSLFFRFLASFHVLKTFIPEEIVNQLLRGEEIQQGTVHATVMVTDIRGYTTLSESRTPRQVLELLNDYHQETVSLYKKFGGHVLNYQGDAQIILFGHPRKLKDAPYRAIQAAQAASGAVERLRKRWKLPPDQQFNVGAGICTGRVVIADLGSEQREYTVIGETVRKGHKLQSQSQVLGANIILDEETFEACQTKPEVEKREDVVIEGLPAPVTVYITDLT